MSVFKVYDKETNNEFMVYDVRVDGNGYPQFLMRINGEWRYRSAKYYSDTISLSTIPDMERINSLPSYDEIVRHRMYLNN